MPMTHEQALERVKLDREMDPDLQVIRDHIEGAYSTDGNGGEDFHPVLAKQDREKLFQAFLSLSRRLEAIESDAGAAAAMLAI